MQVIKECEHLIDNFINNYNVTLFVYGQTGSGKTYTLSENGII